MKRTLPENKSMGPRRRDREVEEKKRKVPDYANDLRVL